MRRMLPLWMAAMVAWAGGGALPAQAGDDLTADAIVERLVERARTAPERMALMRVGFVRHTLIEELDRSGEVTGRTSKEHQVALQGDRQTVHLLRINGRALSRREAEAERSREGENRRRYAQRGDRVRAGNREFIDEKLIRRFRYTLLGREPVEGRTAYVLQLTAPGDPDEGSIADRILARLAGRIWIDTEEFELARVEARLQQALPIFGNIAGRIDDLDFRVERLRLADGNWVNTVLGSEASGRKLVVPFRVRMHIREEGFQTLPPPAGESSGGVSAD